MCNGALVLKISLYRYDLTRFTRLRGSRKLVQSIFMTLQILEDLCPSALAPAFIEGCYSERSVCLLNLAIDLLKFQELELPAC